MQAYKSGLNTPIPTDAYIDRSKAVLLLQIFFVCRLLQLQSNLNSSNTDGSFTMANSNSFLSPYEFLPMDQEYKYLRKLSYFIMKLYVECTH